LICNYLKEIKKTAHKQDYIGFFKLLVTAGWTPRYLGAYTTVLSTPSLRAA